MTRSRKLVTLGAAFILTLCGLGLGPAFMLIECNIRQMVYGQADPGVAFSVEEGLPTLTDTATGESLELLSGEQRRGVAAVLPAGIRTTLWLLQKEADFATRLWEWADGND